MRGLDTEGIGRYRTAELPDSSRRNGDRNVCPCPENRLIINHGPVMHFSLIDPFLALVFRPGRGILVGVFDIATGWERHLRHVSVGVVGKRVTAPVWQLNARNHLQRAGSAEPRWIRHIGNRAECDRVDLGCASRTLQRDRLNV